MPPETGKLPRESALRALRKGWQSAFKGIRQGGSQLAVHLPAPVRRALSGPVAYADLLFVDHGVFRLVYLNRHAMSPRTWRSAQPAPHDIRQFARQGIKTIINLRGARDCGAYRLERAACAAAGIALIDFTLGSREAPSKSQIKAANELFQRATYPMLMHCKSGADRAGLMGVLYMHLHEHAPMVEAIKQLSWRYGHFRDASTGVLDAFFEQYLAFDTQTPTPFLAWVEQYYDPVALKRDFRPSGPATLLVDRILRRE